MEKIILMPQKMRITAMAREILDEVCRMRKERPVNPGHQTGKELQHIPFCLFRKPRFKNQALSSQKASQIRS
jgi:hypothetical protein